MRRFGRGDLEALRPVFADAYAARFYPAMQSTVGLERWIAWNLNNYQDHGFGLWALELRESKQFIGDAGITWQMVEDERILEIGWHIHPAFRTLGYATEAGKACLVYGFTELQATTLGSIVHPANPASIAVASRVHAQQRRYDGKDGTMLLFSTQASQFPR